MDNINLPSLCPASYSGLDGKLVEAILQGQDQEELDRLMERSNVVNQINREVRNLLQMFQDMVRHPSITPGNTVTLMMPSFPLPSHLQAALVDAQQETVDSITVHIASKPKLQLFVIACMQMASLSFASFCSVCVIISGAKEYTGQAAVELIAAADYQLRARKKMCICIVLVLIIVGVIVGIVVATQEGNNNNNN
eukprot:1352910-Amorphochlora_amoeboformis.AAC.1